MVKEIFFSWQFLAVFSTLVWAVINIIDKHVISERIKQARVATIFTGISSIIIVAILSFFTTITIPDFFLLLITVFGGILWIIAVVFYYKALQVEEVSRVIPIFLLDPIFTAVLAAIFLGEIFSTTIYGGIVFVVLGAILISLKKTETLHFGKSLWLILTSTLLISIDGIILKFVLKEVDFLSVFFWGRVGAIIGVIPIFLLYNKQFLQTIKQKTKISAILLGTDLISGATGIIFTLAIALGPVTLVSAITATLPLFVFILATIISLLKPEILREETGKTSIAVKLAAIIIMIVGSYLALV